MPYWTLWEGQFALLFFWWYGAHRDLHSFPTRRSSDLERRRVIHLRGLAVSLRGRTAERGRWTDRKSTRLNSSHVSISYAVFCLKKKKKGSTNRERKWPSR